MTGKSNTDIDKSKQKLAKQRQCREIGQKIKELRSLLGAGDPITQEALGKRLGVARSQISSWEAGKEKPGAGKLIALAREAPDPESLYFWQQAGVDPPEIEMSLRARMHRAGERIVLPEMSRIPKLSIAALLERLNGGARTTAESADYILLPSRFVVEDPSIVCVQVPPNSGNSQLSVGDLVLIDTSQRAVNKCLSCFVALACENDLLMRGLKPEIVRLQFHGPILTEKDKKEMELNRSRNPLVRAEEDQRAEELWGKYVRPLLPDVLFGMLRVDIPYGMQNESSEGLSEGIPWRLMLDGGTFETVLTRWRTERLFLDETLAFSEDPKIRILGVVIGWLRAPRVSASKLATAVIEPVAVDD